MMPAAAVSGLYFAHPQSPLLRRRQDRPRSGRRLPAQRNALTEVERWLAPALGYEPETVSDPNVSPRLRVLRVKPFSVASRRAEQIFRNVHPRQFDGNAQRQGDRRIGLQSERRSRARRLNLALDRDARLADRTIPLNCRPRRERRARQRAEGVVERGAVAHGIGAKATTGMGGAGWCG